MSDPADRPVRHFMAGRLLHRGDATGKSGNVKVRIELECGCEVEREVDATRILEIDQKGTAPQFVVAGKFICRRHSFQE